MIQSNSGTPADWRPGQTVSFQARGATCVGVVVKCNRRTVLVATPRGRWRVPPGLLTAGGEVPQGAVDDVSPVPGIGKGDIVELGGRDGRWLVVNTRAAALYIVGGAPPFTRLRAPISAATLAPARDRAAIDLRIAIDTERSGWRIGDRVRVRAEISVPGFSEGAIVGFGTERAQVSDVRGRRWSIPYGALDPRRKRSGDATRVRKVHGFANGLLGKQADRLGDWRFALDDGQRRAGACFPLRRLVTVSRQFALEARWDEVRDTVIHEVAHALTPGNNHGPAWRAAARELGGSARRTHSVPFGTRRRGA